MKREVYFGAEKPCNPCIGFFMACISNELVEDYPCHGRGDLESSGYSQRTILYHTKSNHMKNARMLQVNRHHVTQLAHVCGGRH